MMKQGNTDFWFDGSAKFVATSRLHFLMTERLYGTACIDADSLQAQALMAKVLREIPSFEVLQNNLREDKRLKVSNMDGNERQILEHGSLLGVAALMMMLKLVRYYNKYVQVSLTPQTETPANISDPKKISGEGRKLEDISKLDIYVDAMLSYNMCIQGETKVLKRLAEYQAAFISIAEPIADRYLNTELEYQLSNYPDALDDPDMKNLGKSIDEFIAAYLDAESVLTPNNPNK